MNPISKSIDSLLLLVTIFTNNQRLSFDYLIPLVDIKDELSEWIFHYSEESLDKLSGNLDFMIALIYALSIEESITSDVFQKLLRLVLDTKSDEVYDLTVKVYLTLQQGLNKLERVLFSVLNSSIVNTKEFANRFKLYNLDSDQREYVKLIVSLRNLNLFKNIKASNGNLSERECGKKRAHTYCCIHMHFS